MNILVTGGCGYIGSHTLIELFTNNYNVICIDNFSNSKPEVLGAIKEIAKQELKFYEGDVCDKDILHQIFKENQIDAVIHFAGYKAVGVSVSEPLLYYRNNLDSTLSLLEVMKENKCKRFIFSSSATVYGTPKDLPISEDASLSTTNPYGTTKLIIEGILQDLYKSDNSWDITILRYFNPIGAHKSGLIGENPNDVPNNLMPYIVKVAIGEYSKLNVFGDDYDTHDGTGVRDYIHVVDLAKGHVKALDNNKNGLNIYNLGTGQGYSVLDLIKTFEKVNNVKIPYEVVARRKGDIASCYANPSLAKKELDWKAEFDIEDMCLDSYNYAKTKQ